jgi:hypothetical protein
VTLRDLTAHSIVIPSAMTALNLTTLLFYCPLYRLRFHLESLYQPGYLPAVQGSGILFTCLYRIEDVGLKWVTISIAYGNWSPYQVTGLYY